MTGHGDAAPATRSPFGALLIRYRTARGLTQEGLAAAIRGDRIATRSIINWEGKRARARDWILPHRTMLQLLVDALHLDRVEHFALVDAWSTAHEQRRVSLPAQAPSSFVPEGRERAIASAIAAWDRASSGTPQMLFVGGIAGIGKTAFARHLCDRIAGSRDPVMIGWGSASSWATTVEPYLPFRSALDRVLVEPGPASALPGRYPSRPTLNEDAITRIAESVPVLAGPILAARSVRGMSAHSITLDRAAIDVLLGDRPHIGTSDLVEEACRLLVDLAGFWPLVLVLEDLHWAGEPTTTLLLALARHMETVRDTRLLVVCTYRSNQMLPDAAQGEHPLVKLIATLGYAPHLTHLHLNTTMLPEAGKAYIRATLQRTPLEPCREHDLAEWLYAQTSGHPMLTEELLRHLTTTGALVPSGNGDWWAYVPEKIPTERPAIISTFIDNRLARVSHEAHRILEIAAVMDDLVLSDVIAEIMHTDEESVLEIIDRQLVDMHQLLFPGPPLQLPQVSSASWRFPHALFREHVYAEIPEGRRRRLHLGCAQAMERRFPNTNQTTLARIARHYICADEWAAARQRAARMAHLSMNALQWDVATHWLDQAEELAVKVQDAHGLWMAKADRLNVLRGTGAYDAALRQGERVLHVASVHDWEHVQATAHQYLGKIHYDLGQLAEGQQHLSLALAAHLAQHRNEPAALSALMLSHLTYRQGAYDVARAYAHQCLTLSRGLETRWILAEGLMAVANCDADLGQYHEAISGYETLLEVLSIGSIESVELIAMMNIGLCRVQLGEYNEAARVLTELLTQLGTQPGSRLTSHATLYMGFALEGLGDLDGAEAAFRQAAETRRHYGQIPTMLDCLAGMLRVAVMRQDREAVKPLAAEIEAALDEHGLVGPEDPILVLVSLARGYAMVADDPAYRAAITRALGLMRDRAETMTDPAARASYLGNVPANIDLLAMVTGLENDTAP